jgi:hypothetical protein
MHAAILKNSHRLQQYVSIMADGQWHSTRTLQRVTGSMATATDLSELRKNNIPVSPARYAGKSETGAKIYMYRIEKQKEMAA